MNRIRLYFPKILLTFLLVFLLTGVELSLLIQQKALSYATFATITEQQTLDEKAYSAIETYFRSRSNSTGIPAEIYLDSLEQNDLKQGILNSAAQACAYLNGQSEEYAFTMDFTELETAVTDFFNQYADENNYQKDDIFYQKTEAAIQEAEAKILSVTDTFKFSALYENGLLKKIRTGLALFRKCLTVLCVITIIILLALLLCCHGTESLYWLGLSGTISGLLVSVPCLYILGTDYFSGFVIKDPQIFAAVVGYLQFITRKISTAFLVTGAAGILLLILFSIIYHHQNNKTAVS